MILYFTIFPIIINFIVIDGIKILFNTNYEITSRLSSMLHALVSCFFATLFIYNFITYEIFKACIYYNFIYILYDSHLYISNKINTSDKNLMLIHHGMFVAAMIFSFSYPQYYSQALLCESSTIFLNMSWFSYKKIINEKYLYINTILLWLSFLLFRIVNIYKLINIIFESKKNTWFCYCLSIFYALNIYWFVLLTQKIINFDSKKNN